MIQLRQAADGLTPGRKIKLRTKTPPHHYDLEEKAKAKRKNSKAFGKTRVINRYDGIVFFVAQVHALLFGGL